MGAPRPPRANGDGRSPGRTDATKQAFTDGVLVVVDAIATQLAPNDPRSARANALSVLALMVGSRLRYPLSWVVGCALCAGGRTV